VEGREAKEWSSKSGEQARNKIPACDFGACKNYIESNKNDIGK
jgi:hypothetical protein